MSSISTDINGDHAVIELFNKVTSDNASAVESDITAFLSANTHSSVILDMDKLSHISSAGLRVVLRLRKREPSLRLINVSPEVYDILDMTGFTEMLDIEKAYRRISVDGCEVIGQGANGCVYRLDPDTVVKYYFDPDCLPAIRRERELARSAFVGGVPTAIPYDVVRINDSYGTVFELLDAKTLAQMIAEAPEKRDRYVAMYADLMRTLHATPVQPGTMPDEREVAISWVNYLKDHLPAATYQKTLRLILSVPVVTGMLHGDYQLKNIMVQGNEPLLIDMDTLCFGHPVFELAGMYNAYEGFGLVDKNVITRFLGIPYDICRSIWHETLQRYLGTTDPDTVSSVIDKASLIGCVRLMRRTLRRDAHSSEGRALIAATKARIIETADKLDTLEF